MIRFWHIVGLALLAGMALFSSALCGEDSTADIPRVQGLAFETDVVPILKDRCVRCHGPRTQEGGLDLSSPAKVLAGGESGTVVSAGQLSDSLLWEMIRDKKMPPEDEPQLTRKEKTIIRDWITGGARFERSVDTPESLSQHDVIPLLLLRCTACHGTRRQEGGLDLRTRAAMLRGGKSGPAVVLGNPADSLVVRRIRAEEMPPRRELVAASVKTMQADELQRLEAWIEQGLPESDEAPNVATTAQDPLVSDEDRSFWSFQPPRRPPLPMESGLAAAENSIDALVLDKLQANGLGFSPEADRTTQIRRLSFDLTGLPPEPEQVRAFLKNNDPLAYENSVERLLASPRYGERWGRHWLDVAGYADSEGAQNEDRVRLHMWRYRDYVVQAFNADKAYDRFVHEQIAGDELADYTSAATIDQPLYDNLVATGFLRTAPDRTFADITNFVPDRLEVVAEEIQVFSSAILGLTIQCARCHSHKFDPLPQRDYYRLTAVFKDALDEHDWLKPAARTLHQVTSDERRRWESREQDRRGRIEQLQESLKELTDDKTDDKAKQSLNEQIKALESDAEPEPRIRALWSRGEPSPSYILKRGNYLTPGRPVGPGVPSVLTDGRTPFETEPLDGRATTGRRSALARWLTEPDSAAAGLVARVMVNRIWQHHFGRGIVATPGNFGTTGARPTHPRLLDWLSLEFVRSDWSVKHLHRLILNSRTYRQSSQVTPAALRLDPDGGLLSRMPLRRMDAEVVRDSLLFIAGRLDLTPFGEPDDVDARADGMVLSTGRSGAWRRSIYVLQRRTKMPTILDSFDYPQMGPNCVQRGESIVAPQALHLLNNAMVYELAKHFSARVRTDAGEDPRRQIKRVHEIAWGRKPRGEELEVAVAALEQLTRQWSAAEAVEDAPDKALVNYCHAVMNSAAFLYVD